MAEPKMAKFIAVEACLDDLFTNGSGSEAERLVLMLPGGIDGGGWGRAAVRDKLADLYDAGVQHGSQYPYACAECGADLTPESVVLIGSVTYCAADAERRYRQEGGSRRR